VIAPARKRTGKYTNNMTTDDRLAELQKEGLVEIETFQQILEMDDDEEDRDFSKSIVYDFFDQATQTFDKMDAALDEKDLKELKDLGHFLKGSSATLGLAKVRDSCEKIQHYGDKKDASGTKDEPDEALCLSRLENTISQAKKEFAEVETVLRRFYND